MRSARLQFAGSFLLALALSGLLTGSADATPADYPLSDGWFFTQSGGDTQFPDDGYAVTDDEDARFWTAFREFGGVQSVGYPVTRRFVWDGFVTQVFQKTVFQWRPDSQSVAFINVFDDLHRLGFDDRLEARLIPPQEQFAEEGLSFGQIQAGRIALLDAEPALREKFNSVPNPVLWYGLPQSWVHEYGNGLLRTIRLQRVVLQLWTEDVPWASAGTVTVANGGEEAKSLGLWPIYATAPTAPPRPTAPLTALGLSSFYRKHLDAGGIPVISSAKVSDEALHRAAAIVRELLSGRDDMRESIVASGVKIAVVSDGEMHAQLPEFGDLLAQHPEIDREISSGGGFSAKASIRLASAREGNLLCRRDDPFAGSDVLVHTFAQTMLEFEVKQQPDGAQFSQRLQLAFDNATGAGLWADTYAGHSAASYWAEGVQSWFDLNGPPGFEQNDVNTRSELLAYDPDLAGLVREVFGSATITSSCQQAPDVISTTVEGSIEGPGGQAPQDLSVWAIDGPARHFGSQQSGRLFFRLGNGGYILGLRAEGIPDCGWIGFYGPGGFASSPPAATRIEVSGTPISGIRINLPSSVSALCQAQVVIP